MSRRFGRRSILDDFAAAREVGVEPSLPSRPETPEEDGEGRRRSRRRRRHLAGAAFVLAAVAFAGLVTQSYVAECNWASPVYSFDSSHSFKDGTAPLWGPLFYSTTLLLAFAGALTAPRPWMSVVAFLPLCLIALILVFVLTPNPCHSDNTPTPRVACQDDNWRTLDPGDTGRRFTSRAECVQHLAGP